MDVIVKISQLLLSLSFLIILHELGHFLPARWFKTRVEKFYLFFDFAPFNSLWKTKRGDTEYGIGWLPLGGYVKISGMVDESMDTEALKQPPQPWEFRSKPAWQRLIIMVGGVTVNFLLGFLIFALMLWGYGKQYIPMSELRTNGIAFDSILIKQGFRDGDFILKIGDKPFERFEPGVLVQALVFDNVSTITVLRDGQEQTIAVANDIARQITDAKVPKKGLAAPRMPFVVVETAPGMPAEKAKIQKDDRIIAMNGQPTLYYDQFVRLAQQHKNKPVELTLLRNGTDTTKVGLTITEQGTIGVQAKSEAAWFKAERQKYSLGAAIPAGVGMGMEFLNTQLKAFGKMFSGELSVNKNLGSFISIGNLFPSYWDWEIFWHLTASLSILLAFMNLLPIPALDGGYVVFLLWEVITGRKVSDGIMEKAVTAGFFLLMGLMIYAFGLDLWRFVFQKFF
jgi:regulator of sigma E protease